MLAARTGTLYKVLELCSGGELEGYAGSPVWLL